MIQFHWRVSVWSLAFIYPHNWVSAMCSLRDLWLMDLREMPSEWQIVWRRKRKKVWAGPKLKAQISHG